MGRRPLATRAEVAEHINVPVGTLEQWAHRGVGPRYVRVGRHARYQWADVDAWLEAQEKRPSSNPQGAA